jgi:arylsulfatase A-like enzyme
MHWHCSYFQMSQQPVSLMDIFTTVLKLANVEPPSDRIIDGINLLPVLLQKERINRLVSSVFPTLWLVYISHYIWFH